MSETDVIHVTNTPSSKTMLKFVDEVIVPAGTAAREQTRGLSDLPADLSPGAREVSLLTAINRAHGKALPRVIDALNKLAALPNWSGEFLVADKAEYNWRTAPWRHYESFADFYQRECAAVWGEWAELQVTYQKLITGKIDETEAEAEINAARRAAAKKAREQARTVKPGGDQRSEAAKARKLAAEGAREAATEAGGPKADLTNPYAVRNVSEKGGDGGNSASYRRRLPRRTRPSFPLGITLER